MHRFPWKQVSATAITKHDDFEIFYALSVDSGPSMAPQIDLQKLYSAVLKKTTTKTRWL
jgi:hypothetical protein